MLLSTKIQYTRYTLYLLHQPYPARCVLLLCNTYWWLPIYLICLPPVSQYFLVLGAAAAAGWSCDHHPLSHKVDSGSRFHCACAINNKQFWFDCSLLFYLLIPKLLMNINYILQRVISRYQVGWHHQDVPKNQTVAFIFPDVWCCSHTTWSIKYEIRMLVKYL